MVETFDIEVQNIKAQISQDTFIYREIVLLADPANTAPILVGGNSPTFPLAPGAAITYPESKLSDMYVIGYGGILHVSASGASIANALQNIVVAISQIAIGGVSPSTTGQRAIYPNPGDA